VSARDRKNPGRPRIALSYMNIGLEYAENGDVSADKFFHGSIKEAGYMQACVEQLLKGGVKLAVVSHGINDVDLLPGAMTVDHMVRFLTATHQAAATSKRCAIVQTKQDLIAAEKKNKLAIVLHQTGSSINESMQVLETYHHLGLRSIHPLCRELAYGGYWNSDPKLGLTKLGKQLIREMQRLNMLVDTAHANDKAFAQMVRMADRPIMDSHAGCRSLIESERNRTDAQLRAIASTGGVTGVHFGSPLLATLDKHPMRRKMLADLKRKTSMFRKKYKNNVHAYLKHRYDARNWSIALGGAIDDGVEPIRASLEQLIDHIEHMVDVAGIDHVCIGSDYALGSICAGVETADKLPNLAKALRKRGLTGRDLDKILYDNCRRVIYANLPRA